MKIIFASYFTQCHDFFWWVGEGVPVLHWRWRWPYIGVPSGLFMPWVMIISGIVTKWWTNLLVVIRIVCRGSGVRFEACKGIRDFFHLVTLGANHVSIHLFLVVLALGRVSAPTAGLTRAPSVSGASSNGSNSASRRFWLSGWLSASPSVIRPPSVKQRETL